MLTDSTTLVATTINDHSGTFYLAVLQTVANETCLHLLWINSKIGSLDQFTAHCWYAIIYIALFEELIMCGDLIQDHHFANFLFHIQSR